jgi:hypothetical protein
MGKEYKLSRRPIALERFRPDASVNRYLIVQIHCDTAERRAELESYVERNFGLSAQAWRSLPLVPIPHTRYQSGVVARLVEQPPATPKQHKARSVRERHRHQG